MLFQHRLDLFLGAVANKSVKGFSVLEENDRRNALYAEFCGKLRRFIDIRLADLDGGVLLCNFIKNRCQHLAGAAPRCIKVEKNESGCLFDLLFVILFCDLEVCHLCYLFPRIREGFLSVVVLIWCQAVLAFGVMSRLSVRESVF